MARPLGLTIICILKFIGSLLAIIGGLSLAGLGLIGMGVPDLLGLGALASIIGIVYIALGVVSLFITWGLWKMHRWAWLIAIILGVISIAIELWTQSWTGLVIDVIVIAYLWYIKKVFH